MTESARLFTRALRTIPGGVHSPVRALQSVASGPLFIERAEGSRIFDVEGNALTDYCMAFGPLILGHGHPTVHKAAAAALKDGWSYGTAEPYSLALTEFVADRIPWVESLRLVNSGTEAVMSAIRLARGATGRDKIIKFDGCYHGHADAVLVGSGSGVALQSAAESAGVPDSVVADTLVLPLDCEEALEAAFARHGSQIAAVLIEPLPANYGLLTQRQGFLAFLRELCTRNGTVLIFDEVITGFRVAFGGMAELTGVHPDLVTFGKVLGGGFPIGAFAGTRSLMEQVAPLGAVYQAGTMSANPVGVRAGLATLKELLDERIYTSLQELGDMLVAGTQRLPGIDVQHAGSMFWIRAMAPEYCGVGVPGCEAPDREVPTFPVKSPRSRGEVSVTAGEAYAPLFRAARDNGIYLPPSPYEVGFLSTAHSDEDIGHLVEFLEQFCTRQLVK